MSRVSRMLDALVDEGIVSRDRRNVKIEAGDRLRAIGDFSALYLHLDQTGQVARASPPGKVPKRDAPRLA
ncbi:MAG TPA: hypothetical protein VK980_18410 [Sphingomonas sp.]|nr:hypothetical protein [Sphingomonas sp.]